MRQDTLRKELLGCQAVLQHWLAKLDQGELPFTDADPDADPIEEQPEIMRALLDDLAIQSRRLDALVEILNGGHLG